jgi:hypothetical protein
MATIFFARPYVGISGLPEPSHDATNIIYGITPTFDIIDQFEDDVVRVVAWADIYEADNVTPWREYVSVIDGTVSVDMSRSERRNLDITLSDTDGTLGYGPGQFWYDKVIKVCRGIVLANGDEWVVKLGEFIPDNIQRPHFPKTLQVTARDFTKKMMLDKFPDSTTFTAGQNVGTVISAIATNAGITKKNFSTTTSVLLADTAFERGDTRWSACENMARAIGFEVFFNGQGYLTFRPNVDPFTAPVSYTFRTGLDANLVSFTKTTSDALLFNDVLVYGSGQTNGLVFGRATNTNANSPTRIAKVGRRMYMYPSATVPDNTTATNTATSLLKVMGLEQFDMSLDSICAPWLEAGDAVETLIDGSAPGDPTRFLLSSFSIPLGLGSMSGSAKRVTIVG